MGRWGRTAAAYEWMGEEHEPGVVKAGSGRGVQETLMKIYFPMGVLPPFSFPCVGFNHSNHSGFFFIQKFGGSQ